MNERQVGAAILTLLVGGIAGGFGGANLTLADSSGHGKPETAKARKASTRTVNVKSDRGRGQRGVGAAD